jgi:hypothetical protein
MTHRSRTRHSRPVTPHVTELARTAVRRRGAPARAPEPQIAVRGGVAAARVAPGKPCDVSAFVCGVQSRNAYTGVLEALESTSVWIVDETPESCPAACDTAHHVRGGVAGALPLRGGRPWRQVDSDVQNRIVVAFDARPAAVAGPRGLQ